MEYYLSLAAEHFAAVVELFSRGTAPGNDVAEWALKAREQGIGLMERCLFGDKDVTGRARHVYLEGMFQLLTDRLRRGFGWEGYLIPREDGNVELDSAKQRIADCYHNLTAIVALEKGFASTAEACTGRHVDRCAVASPSDSCARIDHVIGLYVRGQARRQLGHEEQGCDDIRAAWVWANGALSDAWQPPEMAPRWALPDPDGSLEVRDWWADQPFKKLLLVLLEREMAAVSLTKMQISNARVHLNRAFLLLGENVELWDHPIVAFLLDLECACVLSDESTMHGFAVRPHASLVGGQRFHKELTRWCEQHRDFIELHDAVLMQLLESLITGATSPTDALVSILRTVKKQLKFEKEKPCIRALLELVLLVVSSLRQSQDAVESFVLDVVADVVAKVRRQHCSDFKDLWEAIQHVVHSWPQVNPGEVAYEKWICVRGL